MSLGPLEIILLLVVIALLFGAKRLPELMKGMGKGMREFKDELNADKSAITDVPSKQLDPVTGAPVTAQRVVENPNERR